MTTIVEPDGTDSVSAISRRVQCQPAYVVRGNGGDHFYAAKWRFPPHRTSVECVTDHILCCMLDCARPLDKIGERKTVRRRASRGSVLMIPSGDTAGYSMGEETTLIELYISPALFSRFSQEYSKSGRAAAIQPFFVIDDPWLKGYFEMLTSEVEMYGERSSLLDSLLLSQSQQLLFGHLLRRYCDLSRNDLLGLEDLNRFRPLRPLLLQRVTGYVRDNLSSEIRLADLARVVHLSERHFIRAFHAATGRTPYQYVLEKRLHACAEQLRNDNHRSVAEIAASLRFNSQSHFAAAFRARYGVTPRRYRRAVTPR
jgi:AraC family transcriptional regulator